MLIVAISFFNILKICDIEIPLSESESIQNCEQIIEYGITFTTAYLKIYIFSDVYDTLTHFITMN